MYRLSGNPNQLKTDTANKTGRTLYILANPADTWGLPSICNSSNHLAITNSVISASVRTPRGTDSGKH